MLVLVWSVFGWHCCGRASPRQLLGPSTPIGDPTLRLTDGPDRNSMWFAGPKFTSSIRCPIRTSYPSFRLQRRCPAANAAAAAPEAWPKPGRSPSGPWLEPSWTLGFPKADTLRPLPAQAANQKRDVSSSARRGRRGRSVISPEGRFKAFHHSSRCGRWGSSACSGRVPSRTGNGARSHDVIAAGTLSPVGRA